ncbi:MAG: class I SAM-dependent methyltransferase [bacterium]
MISDKLSHKKWRWDKSIFSDMKMEKLMQQYRRYVNKETREAQKIWLNEMKDYIDDFQGFVVDIATGLGGLFETLLKSKANFYPIATDVDQNVLIWTKRKMEEKYSKEFLAVAFDAKHLPFKDDVLNYTTSLAGFNNVPVTGLVLEEVYRTLKHGGRLVAMHSFVEENSNSANLAKQHGLERAWIEKYMINDLTKAGFRKVKTHIVTSAIWAENPMDVFPVAKDTQYFAIIEAEK